MQKFECLQTDKTNEELISLTHFGDNRPVDIVSLLKRANMLPEKEMEGAAGNIIKSESEAAAAIAAENKENQ